MKPIGKCQGKGIFLFNKMSQISNWKNNIRYNPDSPQVFFINFILKADPYVVQKYISDPLIIGGKKFDMRIYVLVTSYQPLTVYIYRTGFARFTHHRYDSEDLTNAYVHLTNVAIQKHSENYDSRKGGKWNLNQLKLFLLSKYGQEKVSECYSAIQNIIIKSLLSVQKKIISDKHCFEMYGYDILLDKSLKPCPSLTANTASDSELKINLLDDVFTIVDMEKILTGNEEQIGGFDLIYKGNLIKQPSNSIYSTMLGKINLIKNYFLLGAKNNRIQQLKKLAKATAVRLAQQYLEKEVKSPLSSNTPTTNNNGNDFLSKNKKLSVNSTKSRNSKTTNTNPSVKTLVKAKSIKDSAYSNLKIQQTTAFTHNVINNVANMSKKNTNLAQKKKELNSNKLLYIKKKDDNKNAEE